jgi:hypothetical protein
LIPSESKKVVEFVQTARYGFMKFFDDSVPAHNGVILKRFDGTGLAIRPDGRTKDWIAVCPWSSVKYVVHCFNQEGDIIQAGLALFVNGKLRVTMHVPLPGLTVQGNLLDQEGKVVELCGRSVTPSGGLKNPQFVRWCPDTHPGNCDGKVTLTGSQPR